MIHGHINVKKKVINCEPQCFILCNYIPTSYKAIVLKFTPNCSVSQLMKKQRKHTDYCFQDKIKQNFRVRRRHGISKLCERVSSSQAVVCFMGLTLRLLMSYIYIYGAPILDVSRSHTTTQHSRQDSSGRVMSSSQKPLPDNTQHSQQTNIHAPGGIRNHDLGM